MVLSHQTGNSPHGGEIHSETSTVPSSQLPVIFDSIYFFDARYRRWAPPATRGRMSLIVDYLFSQLEEPERFELRSAAAAEVAATQPPELLPTPTQEKEQLEKVTKTVDTLVTGVAAAAARNTYFEGR